MNRSSVVEVDIAHRLRLSKCVKAVPLNFLGCLKGDALALGRGWQRPGDIPLGKLQWSPIANKTHKFIIGAHIYQKLKSAHIPMPNRGSKCQLGPSFILESVTYVTRSI